MAELLASCRVLWSNKAHLLVHRVTAWWLQTSGRMLIFISSAQARMIWSFPLGSCTVQLSLRSSWILCFKWRLCSSGKSWESPFLFPSQIQIPSPSVYRTMSFLFHLAAVHFHSHPVKERMYCSGCWSQPQRGLLFQATLIASWRMSLCEGPLTCCPVLGAPLPSVRQNSAFYHSNCPVVPLIRNWPSHPVRERLSCSVCW